MRFGLISFGFYLCLIDVLCQKSPYISVSVSKITGTGVKEKSEQNEKTVTPSNSINNSLQSTTNSLPTTNISRLQRDGNISKKRILICPGKEVRIPIFSLPCDTNQDCSIMGPKMICCSYRCLLGIPGSHQEIKNTPAKITETTVIENKSVQLILPTAKTSSSQTVNRLQQSFDLACPEKGVWIPIFSLPCETTKDCSILGPRMVCCSSRCIEGLPAPKQETKRALSNSLGNPGDERNGKIVTSGNRVTNITTTAASATIGSSAKPIDNRPHIPILVCPGDNVRIPLFAASCVSNKDCSIINKMVCCSNRCIKGVPPPKPEVKHASSWFGLVERQCPVDPIAEILEIKECQTDQDCAPRICCPDKYLNRSGESKSYCRTAEPSLERFPVANRLMEPLRVFASYMQCTPPPPPLLDIFPKSCKNTLDCFPNLCCQEGGKKYCRPPKRSVLSFVAGVGQRFVPRDAAKRLIERLN